MAVARGLRRLLRIRELEEEQSRVALQAATDGLHQLESALTASVARDRRGRRLLDSSARSGELHDRLAGLEEVQSSARAADALAPCIADAALEVAESQQSFLAKRVERRQAEVLIREAEQRAALDAERRTQQRLDDWFGNRLHGRTRRALSWAKPGSIPGSKPGAKPG